MTNDPKVRRTNNVSYIAFQIRNYRHIFPYYIAVNCIGSHVKYSNVD